MRIMSSEYIREYCLSLFIVSLELAQVINNYTEGTQG